MLVDVTNIGCTKLRIGVNIVNIDNLVHSFFQLNNYFPTTYVSCKQINNTTLESTEKWNGIIKYIIIQNLIDHTIKLKCDLVQSKIAAVNNLLALWYQKCLNCLLSLSELNEHLKHPCYPYIQLHQDSR